MKWAFYALLVANAAFFSWRLRLLEPPRAVTTGSEAPMRVNTLLLLREIDRAELRKRVPVREAESPKAPAGVAGAGAAGPAPGRPTRVCFAVGPLNDEARVTQVRGWLEERSGRPSLRALERRELARYWVYLPPFLSRGAAQQRVSEMRERGLDDIYIIPRGDMANAVSLGVYSLRGSLDRRLAELKGQGYEPVVVPRYRTTKASWFDVEFPVPFVFPDEEFAVAFPGTEATDAPCDPSPAEPRSSPLPDKPAPRHDTGDEASPGADAPAPQQPALGL